MRNSIQAVYNVYTVYPVFCVCLYTVKRAIEDTTHGVQNLCLRNMRDSKGVHRTVRHFYI